MREWKRNWMLMVAICVHGFWGVILLFDDAPLRCTPLATSPFYDRQYLAAVVYLIATTLAALAILIPSWDTKWQGLLCVIPQQTLLMMSAAGAVGCVFRGAYADGVPRPHLFILADQIWGILGMTAHSAALLDWYYFSRPRSRQN